MNNLWKKDSNGSGDYVNIFEQIQKSFTLSSGHGLEKNNEISTQYRNKGNGQFQENDMIEAMEFYNTSLRFAETGTENVTLAYSNRSACFLHLKLYEKCLADIEMAKESNASSELIGKLDKRKADCIKLMKRTPQEHLLVRKLDFEANANFPCLADVVTIQRNEQFGRYAVANCDLSVGKVIMVEKSFMSTTLSGRLTGCTTCQKTRMNYIACPHCTLAMFCDEQCQNDNDTHKYDCNFIYDRVQTANGDLKMIAQTIFFAMNALGSADELIDFVESVEQNAANWTPASIRDDRSKYHLFLTLCAYPDDVANVMAKAKMLHTIIIKLPAVSSFFDTEQKRLFLAHLVAKHAIVIQQNAIHATQNRCQRIGTLGLVFPLFNHACAPNLLNFSTGDQQVCIVLRPVRKGDQLFVSYICADISTRQRQLHLMKSFRFVCKCDKCEPKYQATDVARLIADPGYTFLQRNEKSNFMVQKIRLDIKQKCVDFLNKYGHLWAPELELVLEMYTKSELYEH